MKTMRPTMRMCGAIALATGLAGCATKEIAPTTVSTAPQAPAPAPVAMKPPSPVAVAALPERVTPAPVRPAPVRIAAPVQAAPAPMRLAPVAPAPQYVPAERAAPTVLPPRYEALVEATLESVEARPEPRYEALVEAAPEPIPGPTYEPVAEAAPEPAYEPVAEAAPMETAALAPEPAYTATGDLDGPTPAYVERSVGGMAPIRDDPEDGALRRNVSEINIHARKGYRRNAALRAGGLKPRVRSNFTPAFGERLEYAALARLNPKIRYDARYVKIGYPWGDVPEHTGVCSDVVIRSYRALNVDLQELLHEDMKRAFRAYPSKRIYGLKKPDPNIDHRRVVNLEAFFERTGASIPVGTGPEDFLPGDVLTWRLSGNEPHIGIVVSDRDPRSGYPLVVHNLGAGVRKEDLINLSTPVGHFRFAPDTDTVVASLAR